MKSTKLFDGSRLAPRRRQRPVIPVLVVSILAPGVGHFLVGRAKTAAILLVSMFVAAVAGAAAAIFQIDHATWMISRIGMILVLFSVADATLLRVEQNDGRSWGRRDRPRLAATLDLMFYGVSAWRRGHRGLAAVAFLFGVVVHGLLGSMNLPLLIFSELLIAAWAGYSWHTAKEEAGLQHVRVSTSFDAMLERKDDVSEEDSDDTETKSKSRPKPVDRTPSWVMPTLAALVVLSIGISAGLNVIAHNIEASTTIDRRRVMSMEPFFRNPNYGVALEMNAPGWTFVAPSEDQILHARHVSQGVTVKLSVQPRVPLFGDDKTAAISALGHALLQGTLLNIVDEGPSEVGGRPGYWVRAEGRHGAKPVIAEIWTTGKGWREYVLWIERDPSHEPFAETETAFLLDHLSIENGRPELLQSSTDVAR